MNTNNISQKELIEIEVDRLSRKYKKDFLDCEDILKITSLGRDNVRTLMRSEKFPTIKVGKRQVVNNKTINIEKAITTVPKFNNDGKVLSRKTVISDTKTVCSKRVVPMPEILITALKEYYNYQRQKTNGIDLTDKESFVFCNNNGNIRSYSGTKKILYTFLNSNNLNNYHIHFHTLRHTYSNILFEANQNPKVIQALLGHKSVNTTLTTYNSVDKSYFKKATDVLNKQFNCRFTSTKTEADYTNHKIDVNDFSNFEDSEEIGIFPTSEPKEQKQPEIIKENKQEIDYSNLSDKEFDDKIYELIKMREIQKYKQKLGL